MNNTSNTDLLKSEISETHENMKICQKKEECCKSSKEKELKEENFKVRHTKILKVCCLQ